MVVRRRPYRRFVAWLASVALGLLMLTPTVSRTLVSMSLVPAMDMAADCSMHHAGGHAGAPHRPVPPSVDDCGYCTLLYHSPALTWVVAVLTPVVPAVLPAVSHTAPTAPTLRPLDVRSRAPPRA